MRRARRRRDGWCFAALLCALLAACGSTAQLPEAPPTGPLVAATLTVRTTGDAMAQVDPLSVHFMIDDSGSLVARLTVSSTATAVQTVTIRGSLNDSSGTPIGDVTGGAVNLPPGGRVDVELNGPAPNGTIASATFEVTSQAAPTPTAAPA